MASPLGVSSGLSHVDPYASRPPDWLLTEWYKGLSYASQMYLGDRPRGFTFRLNLFEHIGLRSSFPGRDNQGTDQAEVHKAALPGCYAQNWWLLPEERFDAAKCGHAEVWPC